MRRTVFASLFVLTLTVAGCTSSSATKRTVTVVNTVASTVAAASSSPGSASGVVVAPPSSAPSTPTTTAQPTPTTSTAASSPAGPIVKVDPLKADCATILEASDIKNAIGATVGADTNRIRYKATDKGVTGAIRCLYGSKDKGKSAPVRLRLTQYSSAAVAKKQVSVDIQTARDAGATVTTKTVNGYPATLRLKAGGVLEMQYDTWTLALAVDDKVASDAQLSTGMPTLAGQALVRILKGS